MLCAFFYFFIKYKIFNLILKIFLYLKKNVDPH